MAEAANMEYHEDPGLRMLEERGSKYIQTEGIDTILFINGKIVGEPHQDTLSKITIPPQEASDNLIFHTDYLTPEHNYTYMTIWVKAMIKRRPDLAPEPTKIGKIEVPMVRCQSIQPKIETLDKAAAAKLLGVEKCSRQIAKYTLTGAPRFFREDCNTSRPNEKTQELLASLEAELSATPEVEISLVHSMTDMRDEGDDPTLDQTYKILAECTEGWSRDKGNPLAVYFVNSPSKEMLDSGTVPKGNKIPYVEQLPPRSRFESKKQYMVAMAIGTQQEKEYHDRHHAKLTEMQVSVRFIADPASLHPENELPQELFMLIDPTLVRDKSYFLPRVGDSAKVTLTGVSTKRQNVPEDVNHFTNPVVLHAHRVDVPSTLWAATTHVWKARVPVDKATSPAHFPLILDIRDASPDDEGKILDRRGSIQLAKLCKAFHNVNISVINSDKTYMAEMNAFKKLSAPHTQPLDDRPSLASLQLFEDLVKADLRDGEPLKDFMPVLDQLRQGTHSCKKLQETYKNLTKDKHEAIEGLLGDKKLLKYIHGPPGTGKSHLLIFLICVALLCDPPAGSDDERNLHGDAGPQLSAMDYDKVDQSAALRPVQLTDKQNKEAGSVKSTLAKILLTSGQNSAVDDLVPRLKAMWTQGFQGLRPDPVFLRMYSLDAEGKDFPRRLASLNRQIERKGDNVTDNILFALLVKFSKEVDKYEHENRKNRRPNLSVVDKAIELYNADSEVPQETRKYSILRGLIKKVIENPDNYLTMREEISDRVKQGPQMDAIMQADVIVCTPVGASDPTFRTTFRPHFVFEDEVARDREMTSNILVAHYSPLAFITAGDHKQLGPIIFSAYQHVKNKPKSGFKKEPEEEPLPIPSTFAPQLKKSVIHRLVEAGFQKYQLKYNRRAHGSVGYFFSKQFYNNQVVFKDDATKEIVDQAAVEWLGQLKGGEAKGQSLMIDMHSLERQDARTFSNTSHVNYVLQAVVDLLANVDFAPTKKNPATVMIVVTYEGQRNLYSSELKKRGDYEHTSDGRFVHFDKSRIEIRSHEGAQGHEASVVIVDLVRSRGPGFTGRSDLLAVCSSRAISGQLILINKSIIRPHDSKKDAPNLRHLVAWMRDHERLGMLHSLDSETARALRTVSTKSRARPKKETKKSATAPKTAATDQPVLMDNPVPTKRSKRAEEFGRAAMELFRERFSKDKNDGGQDDKDDGGKDNGGNTWGGGDDTWGGGGDDTWGGGGEDVWGGGGEDVWGGGPAGNGHQPGTW